MLSFNYNNLNIYNLYKKICVVFFGIIIFRIGTYIPIPFFNSYQNFNYDIVDGSIQHSFFYIFNLFSGVSFDNINIFYLGLVPYISASIIFQFLSSLSFKLKELRQEDNFFQQKITQYTRYLTLFIAIIQSMIILLYFYNKILLQNFSFNIIFIILCGVLILTTGSMVVMWIGEQITDKGVGNGTSILICSGILSHLPHDMINFFVKYYNSIYLIIFLILFISIIFFIVFFEKSQRNITLHYSKKQYGRKIFSSYSTYLPLKLNMPGVTPIIFASIILIIPDILFKFCSYFTYLNWLNNFKLLIYPGSFLYIFIFIFSIIFFCFFYTYLIFNPNDVANNLKKSGAYIIGLRPGIQTSNYISKIMNKLILLGSFYISFVSIFPILVSKFMNEDMFFSFMGTSLLIVILVFIDFISHIQSSLITNKYNSLLKKQKKYNN